VSTHVPARPLGEIPAFGFAGQSAFRLSRKEENQCARLELATQKCPARRQGFRRISTTTTNCARIRCWHCSGGKRDVGEAPLAGKSTLNRLELGGDSPSRYKKIHCRQQAVDALLVEVFLEAHEEAPDCIVLDLDVTDLPLHGHQEGRFFHGYYDEYCYLPLYIFAGEHLLCARLRTADQDAAAGSTEEVKRIVGQIRGRWPGVAIVVRADSGFCREELMAWCEQNGVGYVLGLARNERLRKSIAPQLAEAARRQQASGKPARVFTEFAYRTTTGSWGRARRVVAKAEQLDGKENPRFVVTNLGADRWPAQRLYEELYCARGEMENRIKEQLSLFADRVSAETMKANQLRLSLAGCAYVLVQALRRLGLKGTEMARAQAATIRERLERNMNHSLPHQHITVARQPTQSGLPRCSEDCRRLPTSRGGSRACR
jgi:hypothetical protein